MQSDRTGTPRDGGKAGSRFNRFVLRLLTVIALLVTAAFGAQLLAARIVDIEFIQARLVEEFGADSVRLDLDAASFSLFGRRLEATGVIIGRPGRAVLSAPRIVISGIPLLGRGGAEVMEVGGLTIERPLFYFHPSPDSTGERPPAAGSARLRIGQLRIEHGTVLALRVGAAWGPRQVLIRDVNVEGRDISFDGSGRITGSTTGLNLRMGPFARIRLDSVSKITFDSLRLSGGDSTFSISGLRMEPTLPDPEFFDRLEMREDRIVASLPRIEGRGFDLDRHLRLDFVIRAIELDSFDIDVFSNKRLPPGTDPPWLPNALVQAFDGRLQIDSIFARGRVHYRELPPREVASPAEIAFEAVDGVITGISNAEDAPPMVAELTMRAFGAPARTRIQIPLAADTFKMKVQGRVGAIDLPRLSSLTIPLEGIELQGGRIEGLRFDYVVDGPTAGGTVWVAYHDLDIQKVDPATGEGGLFADIASFVTNSFVLEGENMPDAEEGGGARPGAVVYYVRPGDSFFTRLWAPLRAGLMAVAKS